MGTIAIVLVFAGVAILRTTERNLVEQVDDQLRDAGPALTRIPWAGGPYPWPGQGQGQGRDQGEGEGEGDGQGDDDVAGQQPRLSRLYVGHVGASGVLRTLYAPDLAGDEAPGPSLEDRDVDRLRAGQAVTVPAERGDLDYRVLAREGGPPGGLTVAALPLDDVEESVRRLVAVELVAGVAVLAVLGLVSWWVVHLGVRPVRRMTEAASAIAAGDLSARVPEGASGTEAAELGAALNQMLGRIEDAFEERADTEARLRRFLADASHELRTPVATIRGYAELYRIGALGDRDELSDAMRRTEQEALRMGGLIDDLLHLARADQGRPMERAPVDLDALVADAASDAQAAARDRSITSDVVPAVVSGDEARLRQVIANLVGNALVHAPGSPVHLQLSIAGEEVVLEVRDEGPGMSDADARRAFERFYRADASRQRHSGGSGLGLAIVEATVRAHGGQVTLDTSPGEGTTARVTLPLTDSN
jgi:two-component system OmpR family sensor kinase